MGKCVSGIIEEQEKCDLYTVIIDALSKQIPKAPIKDDYGYYICPSCGADDYALMHDSNFADKYNYCHNCGQKIDWEYER